MTDLGLYQTYPAFYPHAFICFMVYLHQKAYLCILTIIVYETNCGKKDFTY